MARLHKPTELKKLHGTARKSRLLHDEPEPIIPSDLPDPTMKLNKFGKEVWEAVGPRVFTLGLMTTVDVQAFSMYCYELGMYKECRRVIDSEGMVVYAGENNYPMPHPLISVAQKHFKNAYDLGGAFGMTPAARTKISVGPAKPKSGFDGLKKAN